MTNPVKTIPQRCVYSFVPSPFGPFTVVVCDLGVQSIQWPRTRESRGTSPGTSGPDRCDDHPILERLAAQLPEYFAGTRQCFDIPLVLNGTPFQNSVWNALQEIRYGHTMSYEEQAIRVGGKEKVRAVGQAIGRNPIPILIPCHRVIGKNGSLTGFGGGLAIKTFLLDLESRGP